MSTPINFSLLAAVADFRPGQTKAELAEAAGIKPGNLARTLQTARSQGLVAAKAVALTEQGASLLAASEGRSLQPDPARSGDQLQDTNGTLKLVPHARIAISPLNPRKTIDFDAIADLADKIAAQGLLQNLVVRPRAGDWELVAGERRWRAIWQLIKDGRLPADHQVRVLEREMTDAELITAALTENEAREDVPVIEQARGYLNLYEALDGEGEGDTAVMAERIGTTRRHVQAYIKIARDLAPEVQAEMAKPGTWLGITLARVLARYPAELQIEALEALDDEAYMRTEAELNDFLRSGTMPATHLRAPIDTYLAEGGQTIEEDGQTLLLGKVLAFRLNRQWASDKAAELATEFGYGRPHQHGDCQASYRWPDAPKGTDPALCCVATAMDSWTGEVSVRHPVIARKDLDALERGQTPAQAAETGKPLEIPPKAWREGGRIRTQIVREILPTAPDLAMALTIVSLLPRATEIDYQDAGERYSANRQDMLHLRREYATGESHGADDLPDPFTGALTAGLEGFSEDGREICDRRLALFSLGEMPRADLDLIFAQLIARHCVDIPAVGGPGASPEAIALAELSADQVRAASQGLGTPDWFNTYPRDTLEAMAEASGAEAPRQAASEAKATRKKDRAAQVAKHSPEGWVPIEARFLTLEQARAAEIKAMGQHELAISIAEQGSDRKQP